VLAQGQFNKGTEDVKPTIALSIAVLVETAE
jgi:hypothetical protein